MGARRQDTAGLVGEFETQGGKCVQDEVAHQEGCGQREQRDDHLRIVKRAVDLLPDHGENEVRPRHDIPAIETCKAAEVDAEARQSEYAHDDDPAQRSARALR